MKKQKSVLIINICEQKSHYLEFVKPIEDILNGLEKDFFTKNYLKLTTRDLEKADRVIICGTSLKDNKFLENKNYFSWIKKFDKPLLGICAGMQIISIEFGGKIGKNQEIGFFKENFDREFLGFKEGEVWHLHNNSVLVDERIFEVWKSESIIQAIKTKDREIYGVLFHPEVRNKDLIIKFCNL